MIHLLLLLCLMGVALYVLNRVLPADGNIKIIINAVVVVLALLLTAAAFGLLPHNARIFQ